MTQQAGNGAVGRAPGGARLHRHFTDEQIRDALVFALELVAEIEPPDDLRLATFNAAWGMRGMYFQEAGSILPAMRVPQG